MPDDICCSRFRENTTRAKSLVQLGKWAAPGAAFLLIPKCPLCIMGYVAAVTGIGLSFSTAWYLRSALIAASIAGALYLIARAICVRRSRIDKLS